MAISIEQAVKYCGAMAEDTDEVTRCLFMANELVEQALASAWRPVPESIGDECVLRTTYNLFKQSHTGDNNTFVSSDGTGLPGVANDPLRKSWDLIKRYTNRV